MMHRFKIVVPSFNSIDYLPKTLESIEIQTFRDFDVCVIDDGSTLTKQKQIIEMFSVAHGWSTIYHEKNLGALQGLIEGISQLNCQDDDVIVVLDGDDWFAHEDVLKRLHEIYSENDIYMTWGQCEIYPPGKTVMKYAQPIPDMVIEQNLYRDIPFVFWHLITFKFAVWKYVKDEDLRDENGDYFKIMKDKATLYPMLEMTGYKKKFIDETLYIYNIENPLNDYANTPPEEHERVTNLLKSKRRYTLKF